MSLGPASILLQIPQAKPGFEPHIRVSNARNLTSSPSAPHFQGQLAYCSQLQQHSVKMSVSSNAINGHLVDQQPRGHDRARLSSSAYHIHNIEPAPPAPAVNRHVCHSHSVHVCGGVSGGVFRCSNRYLNPVLVVWWAQMAKSATNKAYM